MKSIQSTLERYHTLERYTALAKELAATIRAAGGDTETFGKFCEALRGVIRLQYAERESKAAAPNTREALREAAKDLRVRMRAQTTGVNPASTRAAALRDLGLVLDFVERHAGDLPLDESGRRIGFVQGALFSLGLLDAAEERARTRSLFRAAYAADGISVPESEDAGTAEPS